MKKEKTILVTGASGIVGYGILKSLRKSKEHCRLIGTTIYEESAAQGFSDVFEKAPFTVDEHYISWLVDIIKKYNVDMIIPSIEADMIEWNKHRQVLEKSGAFVLLNNSDLINFCTDKWLFYEKLKKHNSPYAIETDLKYLEHKYQFPILLKPRRGFASQGIVKVMDKETLNLYQDEIGSKLMVQPIIGNMDEEYTTSAFFDKNSNLCAYMTLKRKLSKEGFTEIAQTVELEGVERALLELAAIFKPVGPTNFQFRVESNQLKLLEINPRISSATSIRASFGYNESCMSIDYFLENIPIVQPKIQTGSAIRYTEDLIFYSK